GGGDRRAARQGRGVRPHRQALRSRALAAGGERGESRGRRGTRNLPGGEPSGGLSVAPAVHGGRERQERIVANTVQLMGLGGSLRAASTSRTALEVALQATTAAGLTPVLSGSATLTSRCTRRTSRSAGRSENSWTRSTPATRWSGTARPTTVPSAASSGNPAAASPVPVLPQAQPGRVSPPMGASTSPE